MQSEYWHVWEYDIRTERETLDPGTAGKIRLGGDLCGEGRDWRNHDSKILIGGDFYGSGQGVLENLATAGTQTLTRSGRQHDSLHRRSRYSGHRENRRYETNHTPYTYTETAAMKPTIPRTPARKPPPTPLTTAPASTAPTPPKPCRGGQSTP